MEETMTLGSLFATCLLIALIAGCCALFWWIIGRMGPPPFLARVAEIGIVLLGVYAIVKLVLPRLGVAF